MEIEPQASTSKESSDILKSYHQGCNAMVEAENYFLQQNLQEAKTSLRHLSETFSFDHIRNNNNLVVLYTGLPSTQVFMALYHVLENIEINY